MQVIIYDVTLRDGWQDPRKNLPVSLKDRVYNAVADFGPHYIEACWPSSSAEDMEFIKQITARGNDNSRIAAFGSTANPQSRIEQDRNLNDIVESGADAATIFGKTWDVHITEQLGIGTDDNLELIKASVDYLKEKGLEVVYDAEHFFTGWKKDPEYAFDCLKAAIEGGASTVVLCDTKGACMPKDVRKVVRDIYDKLGVEDVVWGFHGHNDSGYATANTCEFVDAASGYFEKVQIHGTVCGYGERCGNADWFEVLPDLAEKYEYDIDIDLSNIFMMAKRISDITGIPIPKTKPYYGELAFANKGGAHVDAERKGATYYHTRPEKWGNVPLTITGNQSGKANVLDWLDEFQITGVDKKDSRMPGLLQELKELSDAGYDLNQSRAERLLLLHKHLAGNPIAYIRINDYDTSEVRMFKSRENGKKATTVLTGQVYDGRQWKDFEDIATSTHGQVDSQKLALIKVLKPYHPEVEKIKLVDYKPEILEEKGTASSMKVPLKLSSGKHVYETVGISESIIEASLEALHKGFIYSIIRGQYRNL